MRCSEQTWTVSALVRFIVLKQMDFNPPLGINADIFCRFAIVIVVVIL